MLTKTIIVHPLREPWHYSFYCLVGVNGVIVKEGKEPLLLLIIIYDRLDEFSAAVIGLVNTQKQPAETGRLR